MTALHLVARFGYSHMEVVREAPGPGRGGAAGIRIRYRVLNVLEVFVSRVGTLVGMLPSLSSFARSP